jgi:hypothetical protein
MLRAAVGLAIGALVGLAIVGLVVLAKFGPLVNTPRSIHGILIVVLIALPTLTGILVGYFSRRPS